MPEQRTYSRTVPRRAATLSRRFAFDEPAPEPEATPEPEPETPATGDEGPGVTITGTHPVRDELGGPNPHFIAHADGTATRREDLAALLTAQGEAPAPADEAPAGQAMSGYDAPFGLTVRGLEQAAEQFRAAGFEDRDHVRGWTADDGRLHRLAAVQSPFAEGGIVGPSAPAKATQIVVHTTQEPTTAALSRALTDMHDRRARYTVRDPRA